jgi:hypothetical protein
MTLEDLADILQGELSSKTYAGDSCASLTNTLKGKCDYLTISSDLSVYDYEIDHKRHQIEVNVTKQSKVKSLEYLDYPEYKIKVSHYDYVDKAGFYYFFVSYWYKHEGSIRIEYKVVNPGGEHLSADLIPNKATYLIFFVIWILVFIISTAWMVRKILKWNSVSYLSITILLTYLMITIYCILRYFYWLEMSKYGQVESFYEIILLAIEAFILLWYLVILNMVANGYKIVHPRFQTKAFCKNTVITIFILCTSLLMQYSNFFLMIFMVVEIVILVLLLKMDIWHNITTLQEEIQAEMDANSHNSRYLSAVAKRIAGYKVFLWYIYIYWSLEAIVQSLRPFLLVYHEWIFTLLHQILILISMSFLFVTLNYSLEISQFSYQEDPPWMPLPFDRRKDAKINGLIVIIKSVDGRDEGVVSVGVECSYQSKKTNFKSDIVEIWDRAKKYRLNDVEDDIEEAKQDVLKITQASLVPRNKSNFNRNCDLNYATSFLEENKCECSDLRESINKTEESEWDRWEREHNNKSRSTIFACRNILDFRKKRNIKALLGLDSERKKRQILEDILRSFKNRWNDDLPDFSDLRVNWRDQNNTIEIEDIHLEGI